jgi:hypothetical protein
MAQFSGQAERAAWKPGERKLRRSRNVERARVERPTGPITGSRAHSHSPRFSFFFMFFCFLLFFLFFFCFFFVFFCSPYLPGFFPSSARTYGAASFSRASRVPRRRSLKSPSRNARGSPREPADLTATRGPRRRRGDPRDCPPSRSHVRVSAFPLFRKTESLRP